MEVDQLERLLHAESPPQTCTTYEDAVASLRVTLLVAHYANAGVQAISHSEEIDVSGDLLHYG